jgi:hypothetical protein
MDFLNHREGGFYQIALLFSSFTVYSNLTVGFVRDYASLNKLKYQGIAKDFCLDFVQGLIVIPPRFCVPCHFLNDSATDIYYTIHTPFL